MTTPPQLSVIIPCYNCEKTLIEAVNSCYIQGFSNNEFEIIMVDDASTDGTRELMKVIVSKYSNIKIIFHDSNKGGGAARNTAVKNAGGEVIFCLDSDDILPKNMLMTMYTYLLDKACDGVGLHHSTKFRGDDISNISNIDTFSYVDEKIPFRSLFQVNKMFCPLYSVFMFTKSSFEITGGYPTEHGFDTQGFAWRFLSKGFTAYTCPDTNYLHRIAHNESYYLREYNQGKINFNWQYIFNEHLYLFSKPAQTFIRTFNCKDFTRNLFAELLTVEPLLAEDYKSLLKNHPKESIQVQKYQPRPITRNSILGIFYRLRARVRQITP